MIYRIGQDAYSPYIYIDFEIIYGEFPFLMDSSIKDYSDVWKAHHIKFLQWDGKNEAPETNEIPDLAEKAGKLFLNEKAYNTLKETLTGHGEFLPVTFTGGTGFIFNPLENITPIESTIVKGYASPESYAFNEANLPPIFKTDIDSRYVFITKDLYRMIRLNGLKGLSFYKDYSNTYAEPEGGYKGSTSMPGYESED